MVSFKRALKNAGKKIKKVFTAPFCSKKKKITERENKENLIEQAPNDSSNVVQMNCSVVIAQDGTQSLVVIETHSACQEISEESLSEAPGAQTTSTEAMKEKGVDYSVEDSELINDSVEDSKETIDDTLVNDIEHAADDDSTTNDVTPLGVIATDVVGEEGVVLTCISNEEIEQMNDDIAAKYSFNELLDAINEDLVLQLITTICYFSLNNKAKGIDSIEEIIHFEVNLTNNSFCVYSALDFSKQTENVIEVRQQNNTTEQIKTEESITVEQNEKEQVTSNIPTENALIAEQTSTIKNRRRNNPRRMTLTAPIDFNF